MDKTIDPNNVTPVLPFDSIAQITAQAGSLTPELRPLPATSGVKTYADLVAQQQAETPIITPQAKEYNNIIDQIKSTQNELLGRSDYQNQIQNEQGVNAKRQQVQDIVNEINTNDANAREAKLQYGLNVGGITSRDRQLSDREIERQNTIKQLNAGARLQAAQGNLELANQNVDQMVAAKYQDQEAKLKNLKDYLEINKYSLEKADKQAYDAQQARLAARQKDLAEQKENESAIGKLNIQASAQGAPVSLVARANQAKTPAEAAMILGLYAGDYWSTKAKISAYNNSIAKRPGGSSSSISSVASAGGVSPLTSAAQNYVDQFNSGVLELKDIYTQIPASESALQNEVARLIAAQGGKRVLKLDDAALSAIDAQIQNIDDLLGTSGYNYKVITGAVQGGTLGFGARASGAKADALAIAKNLISNQTLQSLADAKAKGVTFGALSEQELATVADAASRIAGKIQRDPVTREIIGFSGSEASMEAELKAIKKGLELSKKQKTNSQTQADPVASYANNAINATNNLFTPSVVQAGYNVNSN